MKHFWKGILKYYSLENIRKWDFDCPKCKLLLKEGKGASEPEYFYRDMEEHHNNIKKHKEETVTIGVILTH